MPSVSRYRENPKRAIYLTKEIDAALFAALSPQIIRLRLESSEPIFLYLDSPGGRTYYAERLLDLIKSPDQSGNKCELVSVGYGIAASAAADLLALGDYAILYPKAFVVYHGTRESKDEITLEDIPSLTNSLREANERYAMRLASRLFRRLVFNMLSLTVESAAKPGGEFTFEKGAANPQLLFDALANHVTDTTKTKILEEALKRQRKLTALVQELDAHPHPTPEGKPLDIDSEAKLLKGIIDFETARLKQDAATTLRIDDLHVIQDDYVQLYDFYVGRYRKELEKMVFERGSSFLSQDESAEYEKIPKTSTAERNTYLLEKAPNRLNPLWHFSVSICRILQSTDHYISAHDAYWLGLVDEVNGSTLLCMRALEEEFAKQKEKEQLKPLPAPAPAAPAPAAPAPAAPAPAPKTHAPRPRS